MYQFDPEAKVFSFVRRNERDKIFAVFNFSKSAQTTDFSRKPFSMEGITIFSAENQSNFEIPSNSRFPRGISHFREIRAIATIDPVF